MALIEVSISAVIIALLMMASTMAFVGNLKTAGHARDLTESGIFLETVLEDISAVAYDNLLVLDGNQIFDNTDETDSRFRVDIEADLQEVDLILLRTSLVELSTGRRLVRLATLRCNR